MRLEGHEEPVGGRPGQPGRARQTRQRPLAGGHCVEQRNRLVEHADIAYPGVHYSGSISHTVGCGAPMERTVAAQTLSEKVWERHLVHREEGRPDLLYIDLHLVHEVTSPQAFDGATGRAARPAGPELTVATEARRPDHRHRPAHRGPDLPPPDRGVPGQAAPSSASRSTRSTTRARGSSMSSAPSRGSPNPAWSSSAVTATRRPMGPSVRSPLGLAPPRWSTSWPPRLFPSVIRAMAINVDGVPPGSPPRI